MTTSACSYFILFLWKIVTTRKINKHVSPTTDTVVVLLNIVISTKNELIHFTAKVNLKTPNRLISKWWCTHWFQEFILVIYWDTMPTSNSVSLLRSELLKTQWQSVLNKPRWNAHWEQKLRPFKGPIIVVIGFTAPVYAGLTNSFRFRKIYVKINRLQYLCKTKLTSFDMGKKIINITNWNGGN